MMMIFMMVTMRRYTIQRIMGMNEHEYDNDGNGGKSKKMSSLSNVV